MTAFHPKFEAELSNPAVPERRRSPRLRLQVPVFVRGVDAKGEEFLDLTKTLNISAVGAFLATTRLLHRDDPLSLTVPAPATPASRVVPPPTAPIPARVRRLEMAGEVCLLGVEFLKPLE